MSVKDTGAALLGTLVPDLSSQPERALQTQVELVEDSAHRRGHHPRAESADLSEDLSKRVTVTAEGQPTS